MIGPRITAALQIDITRGTMAGGKMSSITVWDNGISDAPASPWISRKITISVRLVATPHSIEATVKAAIEIRNIGLRPNLSDSQPASGVMIAVAMM